MTPNKLAQQGREIAKRDPLVAAVRVLLPSEERASFDQTIGKEAAVGPNVYDDDCRPSLGSEMAVALVHGRLTPRPRALSSTKPLAGYYTALGAMGFHNYQHAILRRLRRDGAVWVGAKYAFSERGGDVESFATGPHIAAPQPPTTRSRLATSPKAVDAGYESQAQASFGGEGCRQPKTHFGRMFGSELGYGGFASFGASRTVFGLDATVNVSAFTDPSTLNGIGASLSGVGIDPSLVSGAQSAYSMLPDSVRGAVGDVLDSYNSIPGPIKSAGSDLIAGALHGNVSVSSMMPLLSMGLAASGVGAPVAGLLAAGAPLLGAVANLLDGEHPMSTDRCTWIVKSTSNPDPSWLNGGSMTMPMSDDDMRKHGYTPESFGCFNKKRPYGPTDTTTGAGWVKFSDYVKKNQKTQGNGLDHVLPAFANQAPIGIQNDWNVIYDDLRDLANAGNKNYVVVTDDGRKYKMITTGQKTDWYGGHAGPGGFYGTENAGALWTAPLAVRQFAALYFYMWQSNAEMAINGHKFASDKDVLVAAIRAWNLKHKGGSTVTIKPGDRWFVGYLLSGDIDGNGDTAITLPTAPVAAPQKKIAPFHLGVSQKAKKVVPFHLGKPAAKPAPTPIEIHLGKQLPPAEKARNLAMLSGPNRSNLWAALAGAAGAGYVGLRITGNPAMGLLGALGGALGGWWGEKHLGGKK